MTPLVAQCKRPAPRVYTVNKNASGRLDVADTVPNMVNATRGRKKRLSLTRVARTFPQVVDSAKGDQNSPVTLNSHQYLSPVTHPVTGGLD